MKKLYGSFAAKLLAVVLLCALVLTFSAAVVCAGWIYSSGGYSGDERSFRSGTIENLADAKMRDLAYTYKDTGSFSFYSKDPNLRTTLLNGRGEVLFSDDDGGETLWEGSIQLPPDYALEHRDGEQTLEYSEGAAVGPHPTVSPEVTPTPAPAEETEKEAWIVREYRTGAVHTFLTQEDYLSWVSENTLTVRGSVPAELQNTGAIWNRIRLAESVYSWRFECLWAIGLSFLLGVLLFIFLLLAAGHRKNTEEIVPSFVEKIPFDVLTVLIVALIAIVLTPATGGWDWPEGLIVWIPCMLAAGLLFLLWCMSFAVRVKLGNLWSDCLLVRFFRWLRSGLSALLRRLPILWKWIVGLAAAAFADLIFRMNAVYSENRAFFFWLLFWLLAGGGTLYGVLAFRRLRQGAREIADGNMLATVEEKNLVGDFKDHARDLNRIRDGLNGAVDQRMKSERLRTELITNVSHDIKTPLTSIVNYVDLMQKEGPENEKQREYLEVLSRQSQKLKKLIEDLIEASKASTGNLAVELQPCDLAILLDQCAGEYAERLEKAGLELVVQKPDHPVTVRADGRHLWRVFDNLLNNIVKYALPGTRVYLNLREENGRAEVTFRNISREALNSDAGELTERFVRGDASRHTEGNGLGLSIAMSLMRLQKGDMEINVDGDLFKVTLRFAAQ